MSRSASACPTIRCCRPRSFDRIFLVHMYHEVESPYEFLWHLRAGAEAGRQVVVVDADRPTKRHGMPPELLDLRIRRARIGADEVHNARRRGSLFRIIPRGPPPPGAGRD